MRILFALAYYHPYLGGAESAFKGLAEELVRRGHAVRVITSRLPGTPRFERIDGVAVERVPVSRLGDRYVFSLLSLPYLARRARDFDVVHTASNNLAPPALALLRALRKPVVFTCHEVMGARWNLVMRPWWKALVYRTVERVNVGMPYDRHVAVSEATKRDMLAIGIPGERARVVYNGIDTLSPNGLEPDQGLRAQSGASESDFLYVFFGRPGVTKGVDYLLRAVPRIQQAIPHSRLALILSPEPAPAYAGLMRLMRRLGPGLNITVHPPVPTRRELAGYLLDADCVVIPSVTEGFGLTTAEASALGVPLVATRTGAIPEVISGRHVLVDPASSEALAAGVIRAWRGEFDPPTPPREFSWSRMASSYEAVYREVAECG
jgi:D-inositol-3-phosphate glycosyltransferase